VKLKLLHLWEESLYQEFIESRSSGAQSNSGGNPEQNKGVLSSSMRYKLRKKHPCPIELEHELRVKNARLPKVVHDGLNSWLKKHQDNPYPNKAEKEVLSSKLGITPQQVNRWFIQRRKMLRIRGQLYLGRGIADTNSDDEDDYDEEEGNNSDDYSYGKHESRNNRPSFPHESFKQQQGSVLLLVPALSTALDIKREHDEHCPPSLLEKILTNGSPVPSPNPSQQQQQIVSKSLCSGGSVEVMEKHYNIQDESNSSSSHHYPLTPPPSISGDSNARSTPPDMVSGYTDWTNEQREALDLSLVSQQRSKSSPVILEPISPPWRSTSQPQLVKKLLEEDATPFSYRHHQQQPAKKRRYQDYSPDLDLQQMEESSVELDRDERIAVNALLALSKGH
jgi:hypothetical protein